LILKKQIWKIIVETQETVVKEVVDKEVAKKENLKEAKEELVKVN
jgi:hypothetical protein